MKLFFNTYPRIAVISVLVLVRKFHIYIRSLAVHSFPARSTCTYYHEITQWDFQFMVPLHFSVLHAHGPPTRREV